MKRPVTFYFTNKGLAVAVTLETIFMVLGVVFCIVVMFGLPDADVRLRAIIAAIALGLAASAAYYLRRIYRAAFDGRLNRVRPGESVEERIATAVYLLGRPLIAGVLSLAAGLTTVIADTAVTPDTVTPTNNLVYLSASIGFVTGFLSGRTISRVERQEKS